jgi:hypothetical protein
MTDITLQPCAPGGSKLNAEALPGVRAPVRRRTYGAWPVAAIR